MSKVVNHENQLESRDKTETLHCELTQIPTSGTQIHSLRLQMPAGASGAPTACKSSDKMKHPEIMQFCAKLREGQSYQRSLIQEILQRSTLANRVKLSAHKKSAKLVEYLFQR